MFWLALLLTYTELTLDNDLRSVLIVERQLHGNISLELLHRNVVQLWEIRNSSDELLL